MSSAVWQATYIRFSRKVSGPNQFLLCLRLRTDAAKRLRRRDNALYLVFKIVERLSGHWRTFNGGANLMALVLEGCTFKNGVLQRPWERQEVVAVA